MFFFFKKKYRESKTTPNIRIGSLCSGAKEMEVKYHRKCIWYTLSEKGKIKIFYDLYVKTKQNGHIYLEI